MLDRERTEVRRNGEWLDMPMEDLFRLARTSTVAQLLERDDFAKRYSAGEPISILELLYPLLQGYDSVAVRSDVELGGTDQKFNILLARDIQQAYGVPPQSVLTMPILPGIDGVQKMSKSLGNYVGVHDPPEEMFGKLMRVPDDAMPVYYDLLLDEPLDPAQSPREPKRRMARSHHRAPPRRRRRRATARGALRPAPRRARAAGRDRGARVLGRQRHGAPARAAGRRLRPVALRGAAAAGPGRREAGRRAARRATIWTCRPSGWTAPCSRSGKRRFKRLRQR